MGPMRTEERTETNITVGTPNEIWAQSGEINKKNEIFFQKVENMNNIRRFFKQQIW